MMYKKTKANKTSIKCNNSYKGETIEQKINRIVNNKEPIKDGAPLVYTERKEGVKEAYNIRTDRFEIAVDAMDKVAQSKIAKRTPVVKMEKKEGEEVKPTATDKNSKEGTNGGGSPEASQ